MAVQLCLDKIFRYNHKTSLATSIRSIKFVFQHINLLGESTMSMMAEFKEFAIKGNAVDMAVGIVVWAAFGKIVSSFVNDVIMPPIGLLIGR